MARNPKKSNKSKAKEVLTLHRLLKSSSSFYTLMTGLKKRGFSLISLNYQPNANLEKSPNKCLKLILNCKARASIMPLSENLTGTKSLSLQNHKKIQTIRATSTKAPTMMTLLSNNLRYSSASIPFLISLPML